MLKVFVKLTYGPIFQIIRLFLEFRVLLWFSYAHYIYIFSDFNPGIGDSICCDKCSVWQHMRCMGVHPNKVPKIYECDQCNPRPLDKEAAVQLQLLLQEESSSSDDEEDRAQAAVPRKSNNPKRSRKASSTSIKSEESSADIDDRSEFVNVKDVLTT